MADITDTIIKPQPGKAKIWQMFDRISARYDLLNKVLSFGIDIRWRHQVRDYLPAGNDLELLDLATGTGDLLLELAPLDKIKSAVGLDLSEKMLQVAEKKIQKSNLQKPVKLVKADAAAIPFDNSSFDVATIAFGIRNVVDINLVLQEIYRVLKPQGRVIILEFSLPDNYLLRKIFLFYLRNFVPSIGAIISGDIGAYRYLNTSIENFVGRNQMQFAMEKAGFANVNMGCKTFGTVCFYYADKPV